MRLTSIAETTGAMRRKRDFSGDPMWSSQRSLPTTSTKIAGEEKKPYCNFLFLRSVYDDVF